MFEVSLWLAVGAALAVVAFAVGALAAIRRTRERPAGGRGLGSLVGREAVAVSALNPTGYVLVNGERWAAHVAGGPVQVGERVVITRQKGLRLRVVPWAAAPADFAADASRSDRRSSEANHTSG